MRNAGLEIKKVKKVHRTESKEVVNRKMMANKVKYTAYY